MKFYLNKKPLRARAVLQCLAYALFFAVPVFAEDSPATQQETQAVEQPAAQPESEPAAPAEPQAAEQPAAQPEAVAQPETAAQPEPVAKPEPAAKPMPAGLRR